MQDQHASRSLEKYPTDTVDWIIDHFDADAISYVHVLLEDLKSDRLSRCALFLSHGSIEELKNAVSLGKTDYRDLIVAAEYDRGYNQVRDFNKLFPPSKSL